MEQLGEGIRKLILAGIGAAATTKEKSEVILHELVKKGELTVEQGRVLNEELKYSIKEALREKAGYNSGDLSEDLMDMVSQLDEDQLEELKRHIVEAERLRKDNDVPDDEERADNDQN